MHVQVRYSRFRPEISFSQKIQNGQFKFKFGTSTNSNKQNSIVMFNFPFLTEITGFGQTWYKK